MINIRKKTIALVLLATPFFSNGAGIPVFDAISEANQLQELLTMADQLTTLQSQLNQLEAAYNTATGIRDKANAIASEYDKAMEFSDSDINDMLRSIAEEAEKTLVEQQKNRSEQVAEYSLGVDDTFEKSKERFDELVLLISEINSSPDEKDIADLQARIQAEQVLLQNESIKLQSLMAKREAEQDKQKEIEKKEFKKSVGSYKEFPTP